MNDLKQEDAGVEFGGFDLDFESQKELLEGSARNNKKGAKLEEQRK